MALPTSASQRSPRSTASSPLAKASPGRDVVAHDPRQWTVYTLKRRPIGAGASALGLALCHIRLGRTLPLIPARSSFPNGLPRG